jgi:hypothetical protein
VPLIFISFGGANEGGAPWDALFASESLASQFGSNAAALAAAVTTATGGVAVIGIDLDIEDTTTALPAFGSFVSAFRAATHNTSAPLQLCVLSGLAQPSNPDHFKLGLLQVSERRTSRRTAVPGIIAAAC